MTKIKTVISIKRPTPKWATNFFRVVLYVLAFVIYELTRMEPGTLSYWGINESGVKPIIQLLISIIAFVHLITRILGVKIKNNQ